jgi:hypothetical protein
MRKLARSLDIDFGIGRTETAPKKVHKQRPADKPRHSEKQRPADKRPLNEDSPRRKRRRRRRRKPAATAG